MPLDPAASLLHPGAQARQVSEHGADAVGQGFGLGGSDFGGVHACSAPDRTR